MNNLHSPSSEEIDLDGLLLDEHARLLRVFGADSKQYEAFMRAHSDDVTFMMRLAAENMRDLMHKPEDELFI
jgi:sugar (pentulose or hexulose) kinase